MRQLILFSAVLAAACNERGLGQQADTSSVITQSEQVCAADGSLDFHVYADSFGAYEGKQVTVAAFEPHQDFETHVTTLRRPVRMSAMVTDGAFSIDCPSGLQPSLAYPSYAVYVDLDGDGGCGASDVGLQMELYGWTSPVDDHLMQTNDWAQLVPVAELHGGIGSETPYDFCATYFP